MSTPAVIERSTDNATSQQNGSLTDYLCVYAILPVDTPNVESIHPPLTGLDPEQSLYTLHTEYVQAVVSKVPATQFGQVALQANLEDMEWLANQVRAYQAILDRLLATTPTLLPMRFGTIYHDEASIQQKLVQFEHNFTVELERLRNKTEWGVKLFWDATTFQAAILERHVALEAWGHDEDLVRIQQQIARAGAGAAFLYQKKLDELVASRAEALVFAIADQSHQALVEQADDAASNPLNSQQPSLCLNGVYLVERSTADAFGAAVEVLAHRYQPLGIHYELSGPWPAYNFLTLDLDG